MDIKNKGKFGPFGNPLPLFILTIYTLSDPYANTISPVLREDVDSVNAGLNVEKGLKA